MTLPSTPNAATGEKLLGNEAFKRKKFQDAVERYSEAINLYTKVDSKHIDIPAVLANRAMCHIKTKSYELALQDSDVCCNLKPTWFKGYYRRAEAYLGLGDYENAEKAFAEALTNQPPSNFEALVLRKLEETTFAKDGLYFRQLLSGRDIAVVPESAADNFTFPIAKKAQSYSYVIGDVTNKECMLVDPSWDLESIKNIVKNDGMKVTGVIITSCHPHHCGGVPKGEEGTGTFVQGVTDLVSDDELLPVYIHELDAGLLKERNFIQDENIVITKQDYEINIGSVCLKVLHLPGPSEGSQGVLINNSYLLCGDIVFPGELGPCKGLDENQLSTMYSGIVAGLFTLPFETVLYPGHYRNGKECTTIGDERQAGGCLINRSEQEFVQVMKVAKNVLNY